MLRSGVPLGGKRKKVCTEWEEMLNIYSGQMSRKDTGMNITEYNLYL